MRVIPIGETAEPALAPDIVWDGLTGDLAISPIDDAANPGGLVAKAAIATAVLICLQTDCRVDKTEMLDGDVNRGWPGDAFDMQPGDVPLGSRLWLLRRRALTDGIEIAAEDYAREALQTLLDQGLCTRVDVTVTATRADSRLDLAIALIGRSGGMLYNQRFAVLWDQIDGL